MWVVSGRLQLSASQLAGNLGGGVVVEAGAELSVHSCDFTDNGNPDNRRVTLILHVL